MDMTSVTALWGAVVLSGFYHGFNPGMGWPLAVSAALMENRHSAMAKAIAMLAFGHFLAMMCVLLPFSLVLRLIELETEIRVAAGLIVIAMGIYLLINRRHPRFLARVHPARLALWSFLAAMAHGAGLMLVPIFLGISGHEDGTMAHDAAHALKGSNVLTAIAVGLIHTLAMMAAGALIATIIYFWLGLKFLSKTWFNLDIVWAISLILVGCFGVFSAFHVHHH